MPSMPSVPKPLVAGALVASLLALSSLTFMNPPPEVEKRTADFDEVVFVQKNVELRLKGQPAVDKIVVNITNNENMTSTWSKTIHEPVTVHSWLKITSESFVMVAVAELFDKTWFMALLMALRYHKPTVFWAAFCALFVHVFLAAAFGYAFAQLLSKRTLHYIAAGVFGCFAALYAWDSYAADPDSDMVQAGQEEAAESMEPTAPTAPEGVLDPQYGTTSTKLVQGMKNPGLSKMAIFQIVWWAVFIAEWGDRTQIAMIGQHAQQPLVPVFCGSSVAFFLLTLSAVAVASIIDTAKVSERIVYGISSTCFTVFAVMALLEGIHEKSIH